MDLDPELRKRWLDHLAAGQDNGMNRPTREQKKRARDAFNALYAFDADFRELVDKNRELRRRSPGAMRLIRRALASFGRST